MINFSASDFSADFAIVYALSAQPALAGDTAVSRDVLLAAIEGSVLASATLDVTYERAGSTP